MTPQSRPTDIIEVTVARLLAKRELTFFAFLLGRAPIHYDPATKSAATDGTQIWVGDWFCNRPLDERVFVLCHELMHVALYHCERLRRYEALGLGPDLKEWSRSKWDQACDYFINSLLIDAQVGQMPREGLYSPLYPHTSVEEAIYPEMIDRFSDPPGFDEHRTPPPGMSGQLGSDGKTPVSTMDTTQMKQDSGQLLQRAAQAAREAGDMPGALQHVLSDMLTPKVDWRKALREHMENFAGGDECSWRRINRRKLALPPGWVMPGKSGFRMNSMVITVDTSGSIQHEEIAAFFSEIEEIRRTVRPRELHLLYWDAIVQAAHEVGEDDDLRDFPPVGGGGTAYAPVLHWLHENLEVVDVIVTLTDGYVYWPTELTPSAPQITLLTTAHHRRCPYGPNILMEA